MTERRRSDFAISLVSLLGVVAGTGCGMIFTQQQAIGAKFQEDYSCEAETFAATADGGTSVIGCGWMVVYRCVTKEDVTVCVEEDAEYRGDDASIKYSSTPASEERIDGDLDQHKPKSRLGKGFTKYDDETKTRVFGWKSVLFVTVDEERLFEADFAVVTEDEGQLVARERLVLSLRFRWQPAEPGRFRDCHSVAFMVGDEVLEALRTEASSEAVAAAFSLDDLEAMASATSISGRVCKDAFSFTDGQMRELRRFWRGLQKQIEQAEDNEAPEFAKAASVRVTRRSR